ncbi:MAG: glycosyltransferase family 4 protein [Caldilineaceae bacterium]
MTRILLISHDVIGRHMAGPGIRYFHLARVLAKQMATTLAIPHESSQELPECDFPMVRYTRDDWSSIQAHVYGADVCLLPSDIAFDFPELATSKACLVIDGYDPLMAEWLALHGQTAGETETNQWRQRMLHLNHQYVMGDFFICASERQRDWWFGLLEAHGRLNPATFSADHSLRQLIDVVPYGLPEGAPQKTKALLKGVWPGIAPTDKVLLWGGGLWPWLDPITAIRALGKIWETRQDVKLVFPGTKHPNPMLDDIPTQNRNAFATAETLGLLNKGVFFGDWVPYADWVNVLLDSDIALTLHYDTLETRLAFRSRVLEYIWAGLPIVAARGDATSELVEKYHLGIVVEPEDVDQVAQAILTLLDMAPATLAEYFAAARQTLTWERAAQPLLRFCQQPHRAADREKYGAQLGNPYYADLQDQVKTLKSVVKAYESGRFIRTMRWLHGVRVRLQQKF